MGELLLTCEPFKKFYLILTSMELLHGWEICNLIILPFSKREKQEDASVSSKISFELKESSKNWGHDDWAIKGKMIKSQIPTHATISVLFCCQMDVT